MFIAAGSFVSGVIVARWLGAASLGILASLNVVALLAVTFGGLGMPAATTYVVASGRERANRALVNAIFVAIVIGSLLAAAIVFLYQFFPAMFGDAPPALLYITAAIVPFQLLSLLCLAVFLGLGRLGLYNLFDMATPAALVLSPLFVVVVSGAGLFGLVAANAVAVVLLSLALLAAIVVLANRLLSSRRTDAERPPRPPTNSSYWPTRPVFST